jgi:Leucine-rich repeat (LRR) protein
MLKTMCLLLGALMLAACSPRDHFWKKPDIGKRYVTLNEALAAAPPARNLWLYDQGQAQLDPQLWTLTTLERLSLRKNKLAALPAEIAALNRLVWVDLGENQIAELNPALCQLPALTELYLNDNTLTGLPPEIASAKKLTYLNLDRNQLTNLPPEIIELSSLKWLRLNGNKLTALPEKIDQLAPTLKRLHLKGNPLPDEEKERLRKALPGCEIVF